MNLTVADLSESGLLARIFPRLPPAEAAVVGPGDDAAVLEAADGRVVISIDTIVENLDFRLVRANGHVTSGFDVGWKAAAQNLSDISAMGARATSLVVSLTLPSQTEVKWVEDLADGMTAAIRQLGADGCGVVGGDLSGGRDLAVAIAVTGTLETRDPVLRSGARPGDVVTLAGTVGRAAAGLSLMESNFESTFLSPGLLQLVDAQRRPRPPLAAGPAAALAGASSMLDLSDGLIKDAGRIAAASSVAISLSLDAATRLAAPLREASTLLQMDPLEWVLSGGEDYGLLATFPSRCDVPESFHAIGRVVEGAPSVTVGSRDRATGGWDHFAG
ncbi:thiamine-phosphate kinase [Arthrobacter sp. HLT1-21]